MKIVILKLLKECGKFESLDKNQMNRKESLEINPFV